MKPPQTQIACLALVLAMVGVGAAARAEEPEAKSGKLTTWTVTKVGKTDAIGTESLRLVTTETAIYATGELKATLAKKKIARRSHLQRDGQGRVVKYQRVEIALKGAGVKLFEFEGKMRWAPINGAGKPVDVADPGRVAFVDGDLWHLFALWQFPDGCPASESVRTYDPGAHQIGEARLVCAGKTKVFDDKKHPIDTRIFKVEGLEDGEVSLHVDAQGELVGVRGGAREMLRAKWAWDSSAVVGAPGDGDGDVDSVRDRGVGE